MWRRQNFVWEDIQQKCTNQRLLKNFEKFIKNLQKNLLNSLKLLKYNLKIFKTNLGQLSKI